MNTTTNTKGITSSWTSSMEMSIANIEDAIESLEAAKLDLTKGRNSDDVETRETYEMTAGTYLLHARQAVSRATREIQN